MLNAGKELLNDINMLKPGIPAVEIGEAAIATAANPSPETILADIELVISLTKQLKAAVTGKHPILLEIIKAIF